MVNDTKTALKKQHPQNTDTASKDIYSDSISLTPDGGTVAVFGGSVTVGFFVAEGFFVASGALVDAGLSVAFGF